MKALCFYTGLFYAHNALQKLLFAPLKPTTYLAIVSNSILYYKPYTAYVSACFTFISTKQ